MFECSDDVWCYKYKIYARDFLNWYRFMVTVIFHASSPASSSRQPGKNVVTYDPTSAHTMISVTIHAKYAYFALLPVCMYTYHATTTGRIRIHTNATNFAMRLCC